MVHVPEWNVLLMLASPSFLHHQFLLTYSSVSIHPWVCYDLFHFEHKNLLQCHIPPKLSLHFTALIDWQKCSWEDVQGFPSSFSPFSITVGPSTIMCSVKVTKKLHISKPRGQLSTFIIFHFSVIFDSDDGSTTLRHILHMASPVAAIIYHLSLFSFLHILLKIYKSTSSNSISVCIHLQNPYLYASSLP